MEKRELKNQPCYDANGNFIGWFSRSVAVCTFIFKKEDDTIYALIEQRGEGAADYHHHYCVSSGYLNFYENSTTAAARETLEETGFVCNPDKLRLVAVNTNPDQNRQNVSLHYVYMADENETFDLSLRHGGEENEIEDVKWMPVASIYNGVIEILSGQFTGCFNKWAFNHDKLIQKYVKLYETEKNKENGVWHY